MQSRCPALPIASPEAGPFRVLPLPRQQRRNWHSPTPSRRSRVRQCMESKQREGIPLFPDPGPRTTQARRRPAAAESSDFDSLHFDFSDVVHAEAEFPGGILNVSGLAEKTVDVGIVRIKRARLYVFHIVVPDADGAFGFPLLVDDIEQEPVHRHWIRAEHHLLWIKPELAAAGKRSAVPDAS